MRALVLGHKGSVGKRHFNNLAELGIEPVGCDIGDNMDEEVDFAVIASPTATHLDYCMELYRLNIPFLCEKPLFDENVEAPSVTISESFPCMVACNIRFTSAIQFAKKVTNVFSYHAVISDSNPKRSKYGHICLQDIHEFDYTQWLFGKVERLDIFASEDGSTYDAVLLHDSGVQGTIHGDSIAEEYHRELYLKTVTNHINIPIDPSNEMYKKELQYFIDCLRNGTIPMNHFNEALRLNHYVKDAIQYRHHYPSQVNV